MNTYGLTAAETNQSSALFFLPLCGFPRIFRFMVSRNCLKCGADLGAGFGWARMVNCGHCGTAHILRDEVFELAGNAGVLHEASGLLRLGEVLETPEGAFRAVGVVRFSYGRGAWDEFWALDDAGEGAWISVDEGDIVLQRPIMGKGFPASPPAPGLSIRYHNRDWIVTEAETARCIGFRGHLPEVFALDDKFTFVNASSGDGQLLSGEFWPGGSAWFIGNWLDPFTLTVAA
jgi:hypothetical protein